MDRYCVDISSEIFEEYIKKSPDEQSLISKLRSFAIIDFQSVQRVVEQKGLVIPQSMRMLEAHGGSDKTRYLFTEIINGDRKWTPVQEWITKHEGNYDALYLAVCNPAGYKLNSGKSIIVYPSSEVIGKEVFLQAEGNGNSLLKVLPKV